MTDGTSAVAKDGESRMIQTDHVHGGSLPAEGAAHLSTPVSQSGPASASGKLKSARQALGLTTEDVAARTRITLRHIEAIEAGDYSAMPGRPYAIGFARAYARAVGLDDIEIAETVRSELEGRAPRPEARVVHQFEVGDPAKTPSRLVGWLALLMIGAILAMGGVFWRSYHAPAVSLPALVGEIERPSAQLTRKQAGIAPASPRSIQGSGPVVFRALEEGIWVKFYDEQGKQLMQKQLAKGESYTIPVDAVGPKLWTGRPDALSITIAGQAVPPIADSEKVVRDVPVDAASLRNRPFPGGTPNAPKRPMNDPAAQ